MRNLLLLITAFLTLTFASPASAEFQQKAKNKKTATKDVTVYVTRTGEKYHADGCQYLRRSKIALSKSEAVNSGYTACSRCW